MDKLFLIYVNSMGSDFNNKNIYEFIFSDTIKDIDGPDWDSYPAAGRPLPPKNRFIKKVGKFEGDLVLDVIQESTKFSVWDAVDGVISLAWENLDEYIEYPENRIIFAFGETLENVEAKLYSREFKLNYIYDYKEKHKELKYDANR
jgi:hypothetical protein